MREIVVEVVRTVGVRWPEGWHVGLGDRLVLCDGQVVRVERQPSTPGQVYGDLLHLLMDGAIAPVSHPPVELEARLRAAVPEAPPWRPGPRAIRSGQRARYSGLSVLRPSGPRSD